MLFTTQTISWNTEDQTLRWYRIQGCCHYPNAAGNGSSPGGCAVIGLETDDCVGSKQQFVQNIAATSLADLCTQLQDSRINWEICSIKQFSRPANGQLVDPSDQCNILTEIPFSQIPACLNFTLQTKAFVSMGMSVKALDVVSYQGVAVVTTGGAATVSGSPSPTVSHYAYVPNSPIVVTGGSASTVSSWNNSLPVHMKMGATVASEEAVFGEGTAPAIAPITTRVRTSCGTCTAMPLLLNFSQNLSSTGVLAEFLQRNSLSFPSILPMRFSNRFQSWLSNYHLIGLGDDNSGTQEKWRFSFEWACSSDVAVQDVGTSYWKFSMLIVRSNSSEGTNFDTRLVVLFPQEEICTNIANFNFNFSFNMNTATTFVSDAIPNEIGFVDNIGLFKSKAWAKNPLFRVELSESDNVAAIPYQDISPIFPKVPVFRN